MRKQGGKVIVATGDEADGSGYVPEAGTLIWDHSGPFHYQVITAHVEPWGEGYAAVCREGSSAKPLLKWLAWGLFLILLGGSVWWLRSAWCVAIGFALLLPTLWLVLRPSRKSVRRMLRLSDDLHL